MKPEDYISELQKVADILQKLFEDHTSKKRKRGNLAFLLMHQRHDIEKIIQYIRRFGLEEAEDIEQEEEDE